MSERRCSVVDCEETEVELVKSFLPGALFVELELCRAHADAHEAEIDMRLSALGAPNFSISEEGE